MSQPERRSDLVILLAEDNPVNQKVALSMLKRLDYKADVANNGLGVLSSLERKDYDVILMDIQMPDMDGLEATRSIREQRMKKQPCIIAMTAYALDGDREEFLKAGMDDYLSKPIRIEELKLALERCEKGSNEWLIISNHSLLFFLFTVQFRQCVHVLLNHNRK